jgi:hypothetical protein
VINLDNIGNLRRRSLNGLTAALHTSLVTVNHELFARNIANADNHTSPAILIDNGLGEPTLTIPMAQIFVRKPLYLATLEVEFPCFTISGNSPAADMYLYRPTLWQRLFHTCHAYRIKIEVGMAQADISIQAEHPNARFKPHRAGRQRGEFLLTPEQALHLAELPKTVIKPVQWHTLLILMRYWFRRQWRSSG